MGGTRLLLQKRRAIFAAAALLLSIASMTNRVQAEVIEMKLTAAGYEPKTIQISENKDLTLKITRVSGASCAREIVIPDRGINKPLPLNETVTIDVGKLSKGKHRFGCAMDMMVDGIIQVGSPPPPAKPSKAIQTPLKNKSPYPL